MKMRKINLDFENPCGYLVENGKSNYVIMYSSSSKFLPAIQQAAMYLREYVEKATGVVLPICAEQDDVSGKYCIFLEAQKKVKFDYTLLAHDGFFIKTVENHIVIDGISGRGILYGAFDFLERVVGVRFLAYDDIFVPKLTTITLPAMDIVDNPDFNDRCFSHERTMWDYRFMVQMRMINEFIHVPENYGGNIGWFFDKAYVQNAVHNVLDYVPTEPYFQTHPEWFFQENDYAIDLDYSHVGLNEDGSIDETLEISPVKIAAERMFEIICNADPSIKYFMIGQMDYTHNCSCPDCLEQEKKFGRSGMFIRFVNAVARAVREKLAKAGVHRKYFIQEQFLQYPMNQVRRHMISCLKILQALSCKSNE